MRHLRRFVNEVQPTLAVLLALICAMSILTGCADNSGDGSASLELAEATARVVAIRMPSSLSTEPYSGISLGEGYIATAAPWVDYPSYCCAKEAPSEAKFEVAGPGVQYAEADLHGLEANRGWMLFRQTALTSPATRSTGSPRGGERVFLLGVNLPASSGGDAVTVREIVGVVSDGKAPLPGTQAPEHYIVVRAPGWTGLRGGLVLDAQRRPAGMVRHFDPSTSGGLAYVVPLAEVVDWATR